MKLPIAGADVCDIMGSLSIPKLFFPAKNLSPVTPSGKTLHRHPSKEIQHAETEPSRNKRQHRICNSGMTAIKHPDGFSAENQRPQNSPRRHRDNNQRAGQRGMESLVILLQEGESGRNPVNNQHSCPGMRLPVHLRHSRPRHMGINLGGGQGSMPQQLLNGAQIRTGIQNMRGKRMPDFVG